MKEVPSLRCVHVCVRACVIRIERKVFRINLNDLNQNHCIFAIKHEMTVIYFFLLFRRFLLLSFCATSSPQFCNSTFHEATNCVQPIDLVQSWKWCKLLHHIFLSILFLFLCGICVWLIDFLLCHFAIDFTQFRRFPVSSFRLSAQCVFAHINSRGGKFIEWVECEYWQSVCTVRQRRRQNLT